MIRIHSVLYLKLVNWPFLFTLQLKITFNVLRSRINTVINRQNNCVLPNSVVLYRVMLHNWSFNAIQRSVHLSFASLHKVSIVRLVSTVASSNGRPCLLLISTRPPLGSDLYLWFSCTFKQLLDLKDLGLFSIESGSLLSCRSLLFLDCPVATLEQS